MGLRIQAESDLAFTLEDPTGFGYAISITDPFGTTAELLGQSNDVAQVIDPETGQAVSGREASATLRLSSLATAFGGPTFPINIVDKNVKPWIIVFLDINGISITFKVVQSSPDRALGIVALRLQTYTPAAP